MLLCKKSTRKFQHSTLTNDSHTDGVVILPDTAVPVVFRAAQLHLQRPHLRPRILDPMDVVAKTLEEQHVILREPMEDVAQVMGMILFSRILN